MLQAILSFFGIIPSITGLITNITNAISNEKIAQINATTQQDQIAAGERIAALQAQRDVLIAEAAQSKLPIFMQTLIASGPAFYLTKVFIYDYCLGLGSTSNISTQEWNVVMVVVGFYFLHGIASVFK